MSGGLPRFRRPPPPAGPLASGHDLALSLQPIEGGADGQLAATHLVHDLFGGGLPRHPQNALLELVGPDAPSASAGRLGGLSLALATPALLTSVEAGSGEHVGRNAHAA